MLSISSFPTFQTFQFRCACRNGTNVLLTVACDGYYDCYGSYLPKDSDLEKNVGRIELFDTAIAILAGLMIVPAVFAFSGGDQVLWAKVQALCL